MTKNIYTLLLACFAWTYGLQAQSYIMDGTPINDCGGFFLDTGGGNGNYGPNESFTTVICPDGSPAGTHIQLVFPGVDIGPGDLLCFFDGPDVSAPPFGCNTDFTAGAPFIIQATAANPGGCITVTFNSDGMDEDIGWSGDINCVASCQTIIANLSMTDPAVMPVDTGWIDICPGDGIFFEGTGTYPQDGLIYPHSDLTSSFAWSFGDGSTSEGTTAYHVFEEPGGYIVQLEIEDQFGCLNTNFINQRVRVAAPPTFDFADAPTICAGDSLSLSVSISTIDSTSILSVTPNPGSFQTNGVVSDSLFLPDGPGDPCYETSIFFSDFSPGQTLTDIDDLLSICVLMEHSFMGDLEIFLTCPDGTEVMLQSQGGGGTYLGEPIDDDFNLNPGVGYLYCWTPTATNGTWGQESAGVSTLPPGDYSSFEPLDNFLGCPLNGEWTIKICDLLSVDNGYIFEWSINLASDLYPPVETFTQTIEDWGWSDNPSIFYTSALEDSISAAPQNAGTANYEFYVTYETGCTFDTIINIPVLPPTHPDCYSCGDELNTLSDTSICDGEFLMLDGEVPVSLGNQAVTFEAYSNTPFDNNIFPNANPLISTTNVSSINPIAITDATLQIESVCVDVIHGFDSDVELYLRAPSGAILELSTDNGGTGNNYTNTCFTPDAAISITAGAPPFTGEFQPEGAWGVLNGSTINGNWSLLVSDDQNGGAGTFIGWTITFANENDITYTWAPSPDLSCLDCPDPAVTLSQTSTFTLETEDSFGCILNDTVEIELLSSLAAPVVDCQILPTDDIQFDWTGVVGAGAYEISLDGGTTWMAPTGSLSHIVTGLVPGQTVDILVRAISATGCNALTGTSSCLLTSCVMVVDTSYTVAPTCFNTNDGFVFMESTGAIAPVEFMIDGASPGGAAIPQVSGGIHTVVAVDAMGCMDSITFEMVAPAEVTATLTIDPIDCAGESSGGATVTGDGGVGGFNYVWNTVPTTANATLDNVMSGTYIVTISDANNCSITEEAVVLDVDPIFLVMNQMPAGCNSGSSGTATVTPVGGTGAYSFLWSNGQITPTATNLVANNYQVTVTDANNCEAVDNITVAEPAMITLDFDTEPAACFSENSGSATAVLTNAVEPVIYVWSNGNGTISNDNITAGNYCLTITDANNCIVSNCVDITEPTELVLTDVGSTPALCANGNDGTATVSASGGAGNYFYSWPNGQATATATNLTAGDYIVTVTDNSLCQQTLSVNVAATTALILQMDSSPTSCFNTLDGTASVTPSGGTGTTFAFQWDANAGAQINATATNLLPGDYCVTVTDDNFCSEAACINVSSPPAIVISNPIGTAVTCFGTDNGQAEVTVSGGSGTTYSYLWNDLNGQFSNPANMLVAGMYTVTVSDMNGCTVEETIEVTEPDELMGSATNTAINCFNDTDGTATASQTGGTAPFNYSWSDGQTTGTATGLSVGPQTVTITDNNGCTTVAMTTIVAPSTELTLTTTQIFEGCDGASDSDATALAAGGTGAYTYEWSDGTVGPEALTLGSGDVTVTVSDDNGCTATQTISITELPPITVNVQDVEPTCFGLANGNIGAVAGGGLGAADPDNYDYTYLWNTGETAFVINNVLGGLEYSVTISDDQGCSGVGTKFLDQPAQMTFDLTTVDVLCNADENGTITVGNINNGTGTFLYAWDANAGNQTEAIAENLSVGTYFVTVTDAAGCTASQNAIISEPTAMTLTFESEDNACAGVNIGSASVQAQEGIGNFNYLWSNGETTNEVEDLGTGSIFVTVTDANGCTLDQEITINQPEALTGLIVTSAVTCTGDRDGAVMMEAVGGTAPFLYSFDDGDLNGTTTLVGIEEGFFPVMIQDVNGCQWEGEAEVYGPPNVFVDAGPDTTIVLGQQVQLEVYTANIFGDAEIIWSAPYSGTLFCPIDSSEICENPISITQSTITYEVLVIDENGCKGVDEITIFVEKERPVYVPTAFTPNGDAVNNLLLVHGDEKTTIDLFRVYDRWGTLVFETRNFQANDSSMGWDGSFKGQALNPGVYVWYLEASYIDGHKQNFKGQTTLIR